MKNRIQNIPEKSMKTSPWKVVAGILIAVAVLWLCFGITVSAKARMEREERDRYYLQQERIVIRQVRDFLEDRGFCNSGVTMGRIVYGDGRTEYRLTIHHGLINALDEQERETLLEELAAFRFDDEKDIFVIRFT